MLTKINIKNFKQLDDITFNLSQSVVLVGPNNAGKTTTFQALCLWELGVRNYLASRKKSDLNGKGYVTINRRDLMNSPIQDARFLWRNKEVSKNKGHVSIIIDLEGETDGFTWRGRAEFICANAESITCRITDGIETIKKLYEKYDGIKFGFLQAMSGLATEEDRLLQGSIDRKLGEGRTAEVLRNICYAILYPEVPKGKLYDGEKNWITLTKHLKNTFGITLEKPELDTSRGLISLRYKQDGISFDISAAGRGLQQTLLLLAYMYAHPKSVLLLDEPDAHLEVIRQRQIYRLLNDVAAEVGSQIIVATHSEVILNEGAEIANIIAIVENTVLEINKTNQPQFNAIRKALLNIGWERYYLARQKRHVLYLKGSTDLSMLLAFAKKLDHAVLPLLELANITYVSTNTPNTAIQDFVPLQQFFPELKGLAIFDRIENRNYSDKKLSILQWKRRELENYFVSPEILLRWVEVEYGQDISKTIEYKQIMQAVIEDYTRPIDLRDRDAAFWHDEKLSDDWLAKIIPAFFQKIGKPEKINDFGKGKYYKFIALLKKEEIDAEIIEKLDAIYTLLK